MNPKNLNRVPAAVVLALLACGTVRAADSIPAHPSRLQFREQAYSPPDPARIRRVLKNGMVVYIQEDNCLPVVDITAFIKTGSVADDRTVWGLAEATAQMMRDGGTRHFSADQFNEEADLLAASLGCTMELTQASATLSVLSKDMDRGLELFGEMLMSPGFEPEKLELFKQQWVEAIRHRYDNPASVPGVGYKRFLYGDFPAAFLADSGTVRAFSTGDLKKFHSGHFCPNRMILAVSGNFQEKAMLKTLEKLFKHWKNISPEPPSLPVPVVTFNPPPGLYFIQKQATQANVKMGYLMIQRPHVDYYALTLMNFILGGGGSFASRIGSAVREREGLAYSVYSEVESKYFYPGTFYVSLATQSANFVRAVDLVRSEIEKFREETVDSTELQKAKDYFLQSLPISFRTARDVVNTFAQNEYWGRGLDHYKRYVREIGAVTPEKIRAVARAYLHNPKFVIVCVGDYSACVPNPAMVEPWGPIRKVTPAELD